jgi:PAS domain S-box-containing protein
MSLPSPLPPRLYDWSRLYWGRAFPAALLLIGGLLWLTSYALWPTLLFAAAGLALPGLLIRQAERRRLAQMEQLAEEIRQAADGGTRPLPMQPDEGGEIGRLRSLINALQHALQGQIDDNRLLLTVSQELAGTTRMEPGILIVLESVLQAVPATGARAVLLNPDGGRPLRFGAGDGAEELAPLDRRLLLHLRQQHDMLVLPTPDAMRQTLALPEEWELPAQALIALPLFANQQLAGVLWAGYAEPQPLPLPRQELLLALANQAGTHVATSLLFHTAEGGRRRMAAVLASTSEPVIVIDQTNRIIFANSALEESFGLNGHTLANRLVQDVIADSDLQQLLLGDLSKTDGIELEAEDGESYHVSLSPVRSQAGKVLGRVAVLHNITRFKALDELKSEFIAMLSHDLRNPLAFMHTYASLLGELGSLNAKQEECVANIIGGIERMHRTIGELLDLNRLESAEETLQFAPIDLVDLLRTVAAEHATHARTTGNSLTVAVETDPLVVTADHWSLHWALNNLVSNALKYAAGSGEVVLSVRQSADHALLCVRDHGPGISKAEQVRIFEKFYRASRPESLRIEGSGLGLAVVKSVAQRHGGRAWVESEPGHGSTFCVALPLLPLLPRPKKEQAGSSADLS